MSKTYQVHVTREGRWWMVHIPELRELTQARRLGEAPRMAQEVIALHTGVAVDEVEVEVEVQVGDIEAGAIASAARAHRAQAAALERQSVEEARELARALADRDVPVRDIGELLGVSFQRADQLVRS
jgi:predicted RNase H-like HicB family nuclease